MVGLTHHATKLQIFRQTTQHPTPKPNFAKIFPSIFEGDNASDIAKDPAERARCSEREVQPYFDKLFKTIQEKTDENGHVVLFQRVEGSSIGKEASEREAAVFVQTAGRCGNYICGCAQFLLTL
jgi:hypothetical protein